MKHQPDIAAHSGERDDGRPRALLIGDRCLYLEALAEFLAKEVGVSTVCLPLELPAEEVLPADVDLLLVDLPSDLVLAEGLIAKLKSAYPQVRGVSMTSSAVVFDERRPRSSDSFKPTDSHRSLSSLAREFGGDEPPTSSKSRGEATASAPREPLWMLTEREKSVLHLVVEGQSPEQIAATLAISRHTVRTHMQNSMAKLGVRSRTQLVATAIRAGMRTAQPDGPS